MTHGRTLRVATDWVAMTGLCADDRYLMVNPYFHMFGLKAGILACVASGATDAPRGGVRRRPRPGSGRVASGSPCCPGRRRSTSPSSTTPIGAPTTCRRLRVAVTGAADIPVELIRRIDEELPFSTGHHRLRAHRGGYGGGHRRRVTTWRPSPPRSVGPVRVSSCASSATGTRTLPAGEPGRGPAARRQRHGRLPRRPRGDRRTPSPPTGGCAPGDLGVVDDAGLPADRRPVQGHVHRRWLQRLPGRDRERPPPPSRRRAGRGDRRSPTTASARSAWPSSSPRLGGTCRARRSSSGAATQMANYKVPRVGGAGRRAPAQRHRAR